MIAISKPSCQDAKRLANDRFLEMLPWIRHRACVAFRGTRAEHRDERVQDVIAHAYVAYARLVDQGKADVAYATPLANYAIRRVLAGRPVAGKSNLRDVLSLQARAAHGFVVERLDRFEPQQGQWREALAEDRHAGPAEIAAARIDLAAWFGSLSRRNRQIARALAMGDNAGTVARRFRLSSARISQLRRLLKTSWEQFHDGGGRPANQALQDTDLAVVT